MIKIGDKWSAEIWNSFPTYTLNEEISEFRISLYGSLQIFRQLVERGEDDGPGAGCPIQFPDDLLNLRAVRGREVRRGGRFVGPRTQKRHGIDLVVRRLRERRRSDLVGARRRTRATSGVIFHLPPGLLIAYLQSR
ncbi:MAG: hypothetical protein K2K83_03685, partial [Rikenella sp.]|nr:hypothetical protein [Rikenella sp.]